MTQPESERAGGFRHAQDALAQKPFTIGLRPFEIAEQRNPRITKFDSLGIKPEPVESPVYWRNSAPFGVVRPRRES